MFRDPDLPLTQAREISNYVPYVFCRPLAAFRGQQLRDISSKRVCGLPSGKNNFSAGTELIFRSRNSSFFRFQGQVRGGLPRNKFAG
jgi:hypothetical protein